MEETKQKKSIFESPLLSTKIKSSSVKLFPEAGLGYLLGPLLALISNGVVNTWLIQYWDKVLMLGTWNPLFETLLPIISAIVIVIGNLVVGRLMEKKPSVAGKARPFILLGIPFLLVALLVLFIVPLPQGVTDVNGNSIGSFSNVWASVIIAIAYNLYYAVAWPIYYTSHSALVNLSTRDGGARGLLSTCIMAAQLGAAGLAGMAGGILVDWLKLLPSYQVGDTKYSSLSEALTAANNDRSLITELISPKTANEKWTVLMIVMIVALIIGCLLEYYFTRERITEENLKNAQAANSTTEKKSVSMGEQVKICVKDKYWWMIMIFFFLYQFGGQMKNNDMSFYSQAMTGGATLSSLINTVGAIPTALGMLIVWPLANKFTKSKTIVMGCALAFVGSLISLIALTPNAGTTLISGVSVASFVVKALGTAPAMYISLALLANILDHQEALYGKRTDGFTMAVYGSIMVAMSGVCNGIIVGFNALGGDLKLVHTILGFIVEGVCYLIMGLMFIFMNVEKYTALDNEAIVADQKAKCLAEGKEWIEPAERARLEEEENARLVEEARVNQLKADCEKKHLDFDTENNKYLEAKKVKDEEASKKKAASDAKKKAQLEAQQAKFDALPEEQKNKILAKEQKVKDEFNALKESAKQSGLAA